MAAVTQRVSNYLGGVSRQSDDKKLPGQVVELINGYPDVTIGLTKRPGFKFISTLKNSNGTILSGSSLDSAKWFYINRDSDTEKYIGCLGTGVYAGLIMIWNAITGATCSIDKTSEEVLGFGQWTTNTEYKVGDRVRGATVSDSTKIYECISPGKSGANAPTGTGSSIFDHTATWENSTAYAVNDLVRHQYTVGVGGNTVNGGSVEQYNRYYKCTTAGTSGNSTTDPTGTGTNISDNSVTWAYDGEVVQWKYVYTIGDYFNGTRDNYDVLTVQDTTIITNNNITVTAEATPTKPWLRTRQTLLYDPAPIHDRRYHLMGDTEPSTNTATNPAGAWTFKFHRNDGTTVTRSGLHITSWSNNYVQSMTLADWLQTLGQRIVSEANDHAGFGLTSQYGELAFQVVNDAIQLDCTVQLEAADNTVNPAIPEKKGREYFAVEVTHTNIPAYAPNKLNSSGWEVLRDGYDATTQLVTTFQENAATAASLPANAFHNHIWHVTNSASLDEDDYWVKFIADDETQTTVSDGHWVETIDPNVFTGIVDRTMPHELINTAANTFQIRPAAFTKRLAGDDLTNPAPSFIDNKIEKTFYHSNRLGFLSGDNVILSQAGEPFNFFHITARTQSDADPIDIACQTTRPTALKNVLPTAGGLILFAKNQQFIMLSENDGILSPLTTSTKAISNFELDTNINPVDFGSYFNFLSKTPGKTRVFSMIFQGEDRSPKSLDISTIVDTWLPTNIDTFIASVQSQLLALSSQSSRDIYAFRTYNDGEKALMQSWFKWRLPGTVQHINIDNDDFYAVTKQGNNWTISLANLTQSPEDAIIVNNNGDRVNPCMDLYKAASSVAYDATNDLSKCYLPFTDDTNLDPVIVISGDTSGGTYSESGFTITPGRGSDGTGSYFSVPGKDLTSVASNVILGYRYDFDVKLPKTYFYLSSQGTTTDYTASLTLARMKFAVGLSGMMGFKVKNKGRYAGSKTFTGDGSTVDFEWTTDEIDYIDRDQIKVKVKGISNTAFTFQSDTKIRFNSAPAANDSILIYVNEWYSINPILTADSYLANDVPLNEHTIFTVPIHQRTENTEVRLFNDSPFPVSLNSMMWEGNYSPRFYRRT